MLRNSGFVDQHYYFTTYPDTVHAGITAAAHYVRHGAQEGRNPSDTFNTLSYLAEHPEVVRRGINPLTDFVLNQK